MPGHKGNSRFLPSDLARLDLTELPGLDCLQDPSGAILETEKFIAQIYGASKSFLLVNGSSSGIIAAICALASPGETVVMPRDSHASIYRGIIASGAKVIYITKKISAKTIKDAIRNNKTKLVVITSPSYLGECLDVKEISKITQAYGAALLVDAAHGAHFPFCSEFPVHPIKLGATAAVSSFHKTLPAFSSVAALHISKTAPDEGRFREFINLNQTSSPSYMAICALDYTLRLLWENPIFFEEYLELLNNARKKLEPKLYKIREPYDKTKITLKRPKNPINNIDFELETEEYVLALTTVADTREGFERLIKTFENAEILEKKPKKKAFFIPPYFMSMRESYTSSAINIELEKALGRVSAEIVAPVPPGIPIIVPGEIITFEILKILRKIRKTIRVIKNK